jgi:hypothetical protein
VRITTLPLILLLSGAAGAAVKDTCFECHSVIEGMSEVFKDDVHYHNGQSCDACHGGDSNEEDPNMSMNASRGFKVRVTRAGVPDYCGRCHGDAAFMHRYNPRQRVDQLSLYRTSVHAARLAANSPHAPECVDCHGVHTIRAVSDPLSPAHPSHVVEMCAKCHAAGSAGARTAAELAGLMSGLETAARAANRSEAQRKALNESLQKARLAVHAVSVAAVKIPVDAGMAATKQ